MALLEVVTDQADVRRTLALLGLPNDPVVIAPARDPDEPTSRGPPAPDPAGDSDPPQSDGSADPPWQDDGPPLTHDDASQVPPDAEI
jgi:hypothetical protein